MQVLFRKTLNLFVSYPVLWLPFVVTELFRIGLNSLQLLTHKPFLYWFATRHTAFGGEVQTFDQTAQNKAIMAWRLLQQGTLYLTMCLSALALILTAVLVALILRGQKLGFATVWSALGAYPRRIAVYAFKFWVLALVLDALFFLPSTYLMRALPNLTPTIVNIFWGCEVLLTMLCSVWIMAPISLALLRPVGSDRVSSLQKRQARYFLIVATVAVFLVSRLLDPLVLQLTGGFPYGRTIFSVTSLLIQLPNVLALIALALIAADEPLTEEPPLGPRIKNFFAPLMPLHFRPGNDL